jgi:Flp pilus assembly protein TadG
MKRKPKLSLTTSRVRDIIRRSPSSALDPFPSSGENTVKTTVMNMRSAESICVPAAFDPAGRFFDARFSRSRFSRSRLSLRWTHRLARCEQGGSLVEFALVLPVLLLLVTGFTTFGLALNNYLELTEATGIGAQQLAILRGNTTDPCAQAAAIVTGTVSNLAPASMTFVFTLNGTNYPSSGTYSGTNASCSSSSTTTGAAGNLVQGQSATMTVGYPCSLAVYGINYAPTCNLTAKVTEIVQ